MSEPSIYKITALARSSHEDRLTETLALVLRVSAPARSALIGHVAKSMVDADDLESRQWAEISTQRWIGERGDSGGFRLDMTLGSESRDQIWIEAKLDSPLSGDDQLQKYWRALSEHESMGGRSAIVILARPGVAENEAEKLRKWVEGQSRIGPEIVALNWVEVRDLVGELSADTTSRDLARALIEYLDKIGATVRPLGFEADDLSVLSGYRETKQALRALMESIGANVERGLRAHHDESGADLESVFVRTIDREATQGGVKNWRWFPRWWFYHPVNRAEDYFGHDVYLEWNFDVREADKWFGPEEPAFMWGLKLNSGSEWDPDLKAAMTEETKKGAFLDISEDGGRWLVKTQSLASVLECSSTEAQAIEIASKIVEGFIDAGSRIDSLVTSGRREQEPSGEE